MEPVTMETFNTHHEQCDLHEVIRIGNEVAVSEGWNSQQNDYSLDTWLERKFAVEIYLRDAGCPLLTSSGLSSLIQLRHLQELELTNCPGVSRELFEYLREHLPRCLVIE